MSFNEQQRKGMQSQLNSLNADMAALNLLISEKQKELAVKAQSARTIKKAIDNIAKNAETEISEHAYLRYFERVLGFDLVDIKQKILNDRVKNMITTLGDTGKYPMDEYLLVLKDNTVITIK